MKDTSRAINAQQMLANIIFLFPQCLFCSRREKREPSSFSALNAKDDFRSKVWLERQPESYNS